MSASPLLQEGLSLMAFGMGFVFVFLTLLVAVTSGMSRLVTRFSPPAPGPATPPSASTTPGDPELMAVIGAAVRRYRRHHDN